MNDDHDNALDDAAILAKLTPQRYRKRPVVIEAMRFDGSMESANMILDWIGTNGGSAMRSGWGIEIVTLEGTMVVGVGDWVIREPFPTSDRQFYPCKPDIFEATYEDA